VAVVQALAVAVAVFFSLLFGLTLKVYFDGFLVEVVEVVVEVEVEEVEVEVVEVEVGVVEVVEVVEAGVEVGEAFVAGIGVCCNGIVDCYYIDDVVGCYYNIDDDDDEHVG
jgi:hypothetical protein